MEIFQTARICHADDDDLEDKKTILFWNTSSINQFSSTSIYLNAFPLWYHMQKDNNKTFCMEIEGDKNTNEEICTKDKPCPDLIVLGTTQLAHRYYQGDTLDLSTYFRDYFRQTGKSIESMLSKYSYYDYRIDNSWLAVPVISDFRPFRFNKTTFDICKKKGYDLHYPPYN
ncbi:hypothetical protein PIROE2DRAFT_15869 [Piromyces sp. E2]|nr:hypothetical protein PIROE2DRAFT_15869 [Piromyces sp. E2]|eukprot:OUM58787.1 hypothetical protein PIROE2DRAFT_15869 [Piromyces sp. E2]